MNNNSPVACQSDAAKLASANKQLPASFASLTTPITARIYLAHEQAHLLRKPLLLSNARDYDPLIVSQALA